MIHIFHKWKITKKGLRNEEFDGEIQKCVICGKRRQLNIHILGYNPYKFVKTWVPLKGKPKREK